jgi:hypothetical protein
VEVVKDSLHNIVVVVVFDGVLNAWKSMDLQHVTIAFSRWVFNGTLVE